VVPHRAVQMSAAGASLQPESQEEDPTSESCSTPLCRVGQLLGCAFGSLLFCYAGPIGLMTVGVFLIGLRGVALDKVTSDSLGGATIIGHRGQPKNYEESREEGFVKLPPGIVWEMDLQRPDAQGVVWVEHDPVGERPTDNFLTLDRLLELADEKNATLIPEFKGTSSDPMWQPEDITNISSIICRRSPWMQTFHPAVMLDAIAAGCSGVKILCLQGGMSNLIGGGLLPRCDAEGRSWGDAWFALVRRWLQGETRLLFIYTVNTRLHAQAVQALVRPFAIFSDTTPELLGITEAPPENYGQAFGIGFVWFGFFAWLPLGLLIAPPITPALAAFQGYCLKQRAYVAIIVAAHLLFLLRGERTADASAFNVGFIASMSFVPDVVVKIYFIRWALAMWRARQDAKDFNQEEIEATSGASP